MKPAKEKSDKDKYNANPNTKPSPHKPNRSFSTDLRDGHGLSKDEALKSKD